MINLSRKDLAVNGGDPVRSDPWLDNFTLGEEERLAVSRVFDSGYLSKFEGSHTPDLPFSFYGGPEVQSLEKEWCDYYSADFALSVNSATSGLFAAIGALGIGYGDEVIVSPYTMTACAVAPLLYGAIPVFADVEKDTGALDPVSVEERITERTKAILVVHQFGIPADMKKFVRLAQKYNLQIIEDCAQAHGAKIGDDYVGAFGDIGVFSLNVNKTIQTGEGGVCITNDADIAYRLALIRNHGEAVVGPAGIKDITNILGFNFRLTEIQAAIAREQLKKVKTLNTHRMRLVEQISNELDEIGFLDILKGRKNCTPTYYICPFLFDKMVAGVDREAFVKAMRGEGVLFSPGYVMPLYFQPLYQRKELFRNGYPFSAPENIDGNVSYQAGLCPVAEDLHFNKIITNEHVRFPHTAKDMSDIIKALKKVL